MLLLQVTWWSKVNQASHRNGRGVSGRTWMKREIGQIWNSCISPSCAEQARSLLETLFQGLASLGLKGSSTLIRGKFSPRGWLMLRFPSMTSSSFFLSWTPGSGQNYDVHSCHRESAQSQYQTPIIISSLGICEQTQRREYELICTIGSSLKSQFLHLSAVPVLLFNMHKYWQLLKYPPKSIQPKWHVGYDTSCITHFSVTWQDAQDCANLSWNKFTRHEEKQFWVLPNQEATIVTEERLRIEVQQSWETLTFSGKPLFPIYIFLPLAKFKIKFEHLMEEVAWSYWLKFFLKIGAVGTK